MICQSFFGDYCVYRVFEKPDFSVGKSSRYQADGDEDWGGGEQCGLATMVMRGELGKKGHLCGMPQIHVSGGFHFTPFFKFWLPFPPSRAYGIGKDK